MAIQSGRSDAAKGLLGQATDAFNTPMDWGSLPQGANSVTPFVLNRGGVNAGQVQMGIGDGGDIQRSMTNTAGDWRQKAQDAITKMQQPGLDRRRTLAESQLANQGITRGSNAWKEQMQQLGDEESRASLGAIGAGQNEASMLFGQDLQSGQFANAAQNQAFGQGAAQGQFANAAQGQNFQQMMAQAMRGDSQAAQQLQMQIQAGNFNNQNRQQSIAEMTAQRGQPLNELNALLSGQQVNMPNQPNFQSATKGDATNYMGAAQNQYQGQLDQFNAKQAGVGGAMNGLFGLGSAAMGAGGWGGLFSLSDERLKREIVKLFILPNGIEVCKYRFLGRDETELGVIAQQVQKIMPDAVATDAQGWLRVNYNKVLA